MSTNFLNTSMGPGHPERFLGHLATKFVFTGLRREGVNFRERERTFRPPPHWVEDAHPNGQSPDPDVNLVLFQEVLA